MAAAIVLERKRPAGTRFRVFELYEWQATHLDEAVFHHSLLPETEYHNAYEADENFVLFRADAQFRHAQGTFTVPMFAARDEKGAWRWLVRFRPQFPGAWELWMYVLHWHPKPHPGGEPERFRREVPVATAKGESKAVFYEHEFGPARVLAFTVSPRTTLPGPLQAPRKDAGENTRYLYRAGPDHFTSSGPRRREPFFVTGLGRPWVTKNKGTRWDSFLDRRTELFEVMRRNGCNTLYQWMAPGECQLLHQSDSEYWPMKAPNRGMFRGAWPGKRPADERLGYKRYDQGRAHHMDDILDTALGRPGEALIQIVLAVQPHSLLQDDPHGWDEWRFSQFPPPPPGSRTARTSYPAQLNGFHLFRPAKNRLTVAEFFAMRPDSKDGWKRRLWKHFANYWRYILARWTAHPALGAWVLADELEGIGGGETWWWEHGGLTGGWHDHVVWMLRGRGGKAGKPLAWERYGKRLDYTWDYLQHPLTSSTTHYQGSYPDRYVKDVAKRLKPGDPARAALDAQSRQLEALKRTGPKSAAISAAVAAMEGFAEVAGRGDWRGHAGYRVDFASHHAYVAVPSWGEWKGPGRYVEGKRFLGWQLTNSDAEFIAPNRWLWDSLCLRLRTWGRANAGIAHLITEYGCYERDSDKHDRRITAQKWDHYGRKLPAYTHFGNWAALMLGHAGIPMKWNDGREFGEMGPRTSEGRWSPVWNPKAYPCDSYAEVRKLAEFLKRFALDAATPAEFSVLSDVLRGTVVPMTDVSGRARFAAWGLVDKGAGRLVAWVYDREFATNGTAFKPRPVLRLRLGGGTTYRYEWFDTWTGKWLPGGSASASDEGWVDVPLRDFPVSSDPAVHRFGDGNDIAILVFASARRRQ